MKSVLILWYNVATVLSGSIVLDWSTLIQSECGPVLRVAWTIPRGRLMWLRIYPSLPGSTPFIVIMWSLFGSQNLPPSLPVYTPFSTTSLYATLPESFSPSQNIPTFLTIICDPPRIYPYVPEYTPPLNSYMRPSQNLPLSLRINPPPLFNNCDIIRPSQNLPLPPRYTPIRQLYATLPACTLPSQNILLFNNYMRSSQNPPLPPRIYLLFNNYLRPSQNVAIPPRIYTFCQYIFSEYTLLRPKLIPPSVISSPRNILMVKNLGKWHVAW